MKGISSRAFLIVFLSGIFLTMAGCSRGPSYPPDVRDALDQAGENRAELEQALEYFSSWEDTLKLKAAYFLIGNMAGHGYAVFGLFDSSGNRLDFDATIYKDYDEVVRAADSLELLHGEIDFTKDTLIYDLQSIKSDFLINQIDFAFRAWRTKPWAGSLLFKDFLEYVLPYRGSNEPLEPWREYFFEKYKTLDTLVDGPSDPVAVAAFINDDVKSFFTFDPRFYYHPTDQGLSEMLRNHYGRCEGKRQRKDKRIHVLPGMRFDERNLFEDRLADKERLRSLVLDKGDPEGGEQEADKHACHRRRAVHAAKRSDPSSRGRRL